MNEFEKNKPQRIKELVVKLNELMDEYHAEFFLNDNIYEALDQLNSELFNELNK